MTKNTDFETVGAMHQCKKGEMFSTCAHCGAMAEKLNSPCPQYMRNAAAAMTKAAPVAPAPQPAVLTADQKEYLDQAQTMLEDYAEILDRAGNNSTAKGAEASAHVIRGMLAAAPQAGSTIKQNLIVAPAPLQQGEYLPLPEPAIKACHCYSTNQVREAIDADRAARGAAQAAPAPVAEDAAYTELHGQINYIAAYSVDALDALDRDRLLGFARSLVRRAQTSLEIANLARAQAAQPEGGAK